MKRVILSISAMLFVEHLLCATRGPVVGANSSLVGQTGTSQNAQVKQMELSREFEDQTTNENAFVYQGVNRANYRCFQRC
jgi:hypothetical protein